MVVLQGCGPVEQSPVSSDSENVIRGKKAAWHFDEAGGAAIRGWRFTETNSDGTPGRWQVIAQKDALTAPNVMKLVETKNDDGTFNLAIAEGTSFGDFDLSVGVWPDQGEEDRGGGPIWRCRDKDNYYICRLNPLEGNFRVYRVKRGRRRQLKSASVDLTSQRWYHVRVTMIGQHITCYLDGKRLLDTSDKTFMQPGMVGVWTKSDAVTAFDDLVVTPLKKADTP